MIAGKRISRVLRARLRALERCGYDVLTDLDNRTVFLFPKPPRVVMTPLPCEGQSQCPATSNARA